MCIEGLSFREGTLEPGTIVERMEPTPMETRVKSRTLGCLREDERTDVDKRHPLEWVVVLWKNRRRRVPLRAFKEAP